MIPCRYGYHTLLNDGHIDMTIRCEPILAALAALVISTSAKTSVVLVEIVVPIAIAGVMSSRVGRSFHV
ncbi:hypothetical protein FHW77_005204 [Agrobacterium sp. RC10-4-1]|nr:hypothetical protein [Agrobacterium sp. RC10-4-1]